ncbi:hypothetical protein OKW21_000400 [Catalinimonas alkaloidigena]|uniref:DUF5606 family protein n=1 Tax=Catalinimonas alkaloidigena TaxID=1075417 RepID=UPI002406866A|nr:DUF5606 domain-containing protein [Catalinimonas alkaloidigena]MDF9795137.1 hypothetical protein [Catalinimonas alkaloidigena]
MDLNEIASISGKGGLFHIVKPTRSGVIVESLDEQKKKLVIGANHRVSVLKEVSIYTTDTEGSVPLEEVFKKIHEEFGDDPGVDTSDAEELKAFTKHIIPDYDEERVYPSDMKKLVNWYGVLLQYAPEVFEQKEEENKEAKAEESSKEEKE